MQKLILLLVLKPIPLYCVSETFLYTDLPSTVPVLVFLSIIYIAVLNSLVVTHCAHSNCSFYCLNVPYSNLVVSIVSFIHGLVTDFPFISFES